MSHTRDGKKISAGDTVRREFERACSDVDCRSVTHAVSDARRSRPSPHVQALQWHSSSSGLSLVVHCAHGPLQFFSRTFSNSCLSSPLQSDLPGAFSSFISDPHLLKMQARREIAGLQVTTFEIQVLPRWFSSPMSSIARLSHTSILYV